MINTKLQSIIDTKSAIGNAITNKGGTITTNTPFFNYAAQIDGISTGTPQTIFAASDGSKWARTNVVNLTNVSNNVTSDFNHWQPANNSTSDPILNIGTVGANISGNIRLVPVNQVNIAQYVNIVINDTTGAKYVGYNGYDSVSNPTPTGNTTFNRWLLNNSASGTIVFANTTIVNGGTFNGPNTSDASLQVNITSPASFGSQIFSMVSNNSFLYPAGFGPAFVGRVSKFHQSNLVFISNTPSYGGPIYSVKVNNSFIFAGGATTGQIRRYHESNLIFSSNTANYGGDIYAVHINNGFVYAGGATNQTVQKFGESNLTRVGNTASLGFDFWAITSNNGFIFAGGASSSLQKYGESNLTSVASGSYGTRTYVMRTNNGFLYVGGAFSGFGNGEVRKYHESNLTLVANSANFGGPIRDLSINNGFIYASGQTNTIRKYYESNLTFVNNTTSQGGEIIALNVSNGFIFAANGSNNIIKYIESGLIPDTQTFYTATKIKE